MNRHLIVVGVGPGIGLSTARRFGQEGYTLSILSRTPQPHARALEALGLKVKAYGADAGDPGDLRKALEQAQREQGAAGVLLYNAAFLQPGGNQSRSSAEFAQALSVSAGGALVAVQAVLPGMLSAPASDTQALGTLLMTGGGLALAPRAAYGTLSVGKAALRALALSLAQELEPQGVHVATVTVAAGIAPGSQGAERIAQHYWELHSQPRGSWEAERVYRE